MHVTTISGFSFYAHRNRNFSAAPANKIRENISKCCDEWIQCCNPTDSVLLSCCCCVAFTAAAAAAAAPLNTATAAVILAVAMAMTMTMAVTAEVSESGIDFFIFLWAAPLQDTKLDAAVAAVVLAVVVFILVVAAFVSYATATTAATVIAHVIATPFGGVCTYGADFVSYPTVKGHFGANTIHFNARK